MINVFGSNYEEIGSLNKNLVLQTLGKVKIRYGKKFIDLLDEKGELVSTNETEIPKELSLIVNELKNQNIQVNEEQLLKLVQNYLTKPDEEHDPKIIPSKVEYATKAGFAEAATLAKESLKATTATSAKQLFITSSTFEDGIYIPTDSTNAYDSGHIFLMAVNPSKDVWHIKYRMTITTDEPESVGYYDCHIGFNGKNVIYNILNEYGEFIPIAAHYFYKDNLIRIGFDLYSATSSSVPRKVKVEIYDRFNCTSSFGLKTRADILGIDYHNEMIIKVELGVQSGTKLLMEI